MQSLIQKLLFTLSPETAHNFVKTLSSCAPTTWLKKSTTVKSKYLKTKIGNVKLDNPIGLAAGFDKNGEMLPFLASLGFGFLELGSITALPCKGNKKPRIFRLPKDKSLINRMGLPNIGADAFAKHMTKISPKIPYGVNIAKTPDFAQNPNKLLGGIDDFMQSLQRLHFLGNYVVFNLSCPNSNDTKTFEDPKLFVDLGNEIQMAKKYLKISKPILIKLSPNLGAKDLTTVVEQAIKYDIDGFVLTNTTVSRPSLQTSQSQVEKIGRGGLSGQALSGMANQQLKKVFEIVGKDKILMGVGGIMGFEDLLDKIHCGASLFQVYTGFVYGGPYFIRVLNRELVDYCERVGVGSYAELVGEK